MNKFINFSGKILDEILILIAKSLVIWTLLKCTSFIILNEYKIFFTDILFILATLEILICDIKFKMKQICDMNEAQFIISQGIMKIISIWADDQVKTNSLIKKDLTSNDSTV